MTNIEKRHIIDTGNLSSGEYFASLLQEAYNKGLLSDYDLERLQLECISFLGYKCERYNSGDSSSIKVEKAESIMSSNLYTIGLYLKSLTDAEAAVEALKSEKIEEMYKRGRELIKSRMEAARKLYILARNTRLDTPNYTYNATLSDEGIGSFFRLYDPDYQAHETMASIDYQLCSPVEGLAGVEYIQKYLSRLCLENEFCGCFAPEAVHQLLSGYDMGYKDLLLNIYEQVLTGALTCILANRSVYSLYASEADVVRLQNKLGQLEDEQIAAVITKAAGKLKEELHITKPSQRGYIVKNLPKLTANIINAVRMGTLCRTFVTSVDPGLKPKVRFQSGKKMKDEEYRELIYEILACRYSSDKLAIIKEKIKAFADFEDVLFDAELAREEIIAAFRIIGDVELAVLLKHHPPTEAVRAVDLSEEELKLRECLKSYMEGAAPERQLHIKELVEGLEEED
jgi:hypothetical protein